MKINCHCAPFKLNYACKTFSVEVQCQLGKWKKIYCKVVNKPYQSVDITI